MANLETNAQAILADMGGKENILTVTNCMTRLRISVKDEALVKEAAVKALPDVLGIVHDREGYYEIVVGPGKSKKYADACYALGYSSVAALDLEEEWQKNKANLKKGQQASSIRNFLKTIGEIFVPLIPGIITAGICAGIASLISQTVPGYTKIPVLNVLYQLLTLLSSSFIAYLSAWVGYRAAERFGATPILGGMLGMASSLAGINTISAQIGLFDAASPLSSVLRAGKGGVLAVIAGVYILALVEKRVRAKVPDSVDIVITPLLSLIICIIPYVFVIMPIFGFVSSGIEWFFNSICMSDNIYVRMFVGYISSMLFLPLVAAGMHHGLVALYSVQLQQLGYVTLYPALAMAGAGQVGAALAIWKKAKKIGNKRMISLIKGALPAGILGVGEPLIYAVTLPLGKPFLTAGIGAGFGGALVMAMQVASTSWGPSGVVAVLIVTAGPHGVFTNICVYLASLVICYIGGYLVTDFFFNEKELLEETTPPQASPENVVDAKELQTGRDNSAFTVEAQKLGLAIIAPAEGQVVPMAEIPDTSFAQGLLGPCVGLNPVSGAVYAPCKGKIFSIADTLHAITIVSDDKQDILVHVGIDTVKLNGKGFKVCVQEGEQVEQGQKIMDVDLSIIKDAGLSPIIVTVCCE